MSAFQLKERRERTIFIGNIALEANHKQVKKLFKEYVGEKSIEKIWFRSIATEQETKMPERAKIITAKFANHKDNKNGYVLFTEKEHVKKALGLNQTEFMGKHMRVDCVVRGSEPNGKDGEKKRKSSESRPGEDYATTIFVGNLPYIASEEEVRACFSKFGKILNVRLVRDPKTHMGKGIGYVQYEDTASM